MNRDVFTISKTRQSSTIMPTYFFPSKYINNTLGLPYCSDSQATQPTAHQRVPRKVFSLGVVQENQQMR